MKLVVKRNHAKPPAGGHRFPVGEHFLRGETVEQVLEKIETHRAENALPLGNPETDLAHYYFKAAGHLVKQVPGEHVQPRSQEQAEKIMEFWTAHPDILHRTEAILFKRLEVCSGCPMVRKMITDEGSKGIYQQAANRRAALLTEDRDYARLGRCAWSDLPIALIARVRNIEELPGLPPAPKVCWVNSL